MCRSVARAICHSKKSLTPITNSNKIWVIIIIKPCHRVLASSGRAMTTITIVILQGKRPRMQLVNAWCLRKKRKSQIRYFMPPTVTWMWIRGTSLRKGWVLPPQNGSSKNLVIKIKQRILKVPRRSLSTWPITTTLIILIRAIHQTKMTMTTRIYKLNHRLDSTKVASTKFFSRVYGIQVFNKR